MGVVRLCMLARIATCKPICNTGSVDQPRSVASATFQQAPPLTLIVSTPATTPPVGDPPRTGVSASDAPCVHTHPSPGTGAPLRQSPPTSTPKLWAPKRQPNPSLLVLVSGTEPGGGHSVCAKTRSALTKA